MGVRLLTSPATMVPPTSPIAAPMLVSVAASTRNCQRIVAFVAPSALRTPISRVRSVTLIIMMAMTPTPPTSRPTPESAIMIRKNTPKKPL
jgi:hypothetical protein